MPCKAFVLIGGRKYCILEFDPEETCQGCYLWDGKECQDPEIWGKATKEGKILVGPTPEEISRQEEK